MMQRTALLLLLASGIASASEDPRALLTRMGETLATREYDGVLVYLHDGRIETLHVVRTYANGMPTASVTALTGAPRAFESAPGASQCTLPDGSVTTIERDSMQYLTAAATALQGVPESIYELRIAGDDRVAGFDADIVEATPRDESRFGFRVWIAQESGMLLGSSRLRPDGRPLEQMMFTRLRLGLAHSRATAPAMHGLAPPGGLPAFALAPKDIPAIELPMGFKLIGAGAGPRPQSRHYLYSDGLASISLYIEPPSELAAPVPGVLRRGAIHVLERRGEAHNALLLGDVPANTLQTIAASLVLD